MRNRYCKIVATVGPASSSPSMLRLLHQAGVDVFRLNFSHGDHDKTRAIMRAIRETEAETGAPIAVFAALYASPASLHGSSRGQHIIAFQKPAQATCASGQRRQHQGPMRNRFIARYGRMTGQWPGGA